MPVDPKGSPLVKEVASVSDTALGRYVRIDWKQQTPPPLVHDSVYIQIRLEIEKDDEWPPLTCQIEALQKARSVLTDEIEALKSQLGPNA